MRKNVSDNINDQKKGLKKMKKTISILLATLMILSLLTGCGKDGGTSESAEKSEITAALASIPNNLDAAATMGTSLLTMTPYVYDYLLRLDEDCNLTPGLASSWQKVDDVTWTFEVDKGHIFSNGEEVEMEDVVYSIERLRDVASMANYMKNIESVSYEGQTLTVKLVEPNNLTITIVLAVYCPIQNKSYCEEHGEEAILNAECGSGPYVVTEYIPGDQVVMELRDDYPFEKPQINRLIFKQYLEPSARYIALETGEAQFATELAYSDFQLAEENDKITTNSLTAMHLSFLAMNTTKAPFDDINVRMALAYAMDRDAYCLVTEGVTPLYTMISGGFPECSIKPDNAVEYDLEKAKELLAEAGYDESNPLTFDIQIYATSPGIEAYQATLKSIGVNASIKMYEKGTLVSMIRNGEGQMSLLSISASPTPLFEAGAYVKDDMRNFSFFDDETCTELVMKARRADTAEEMNDYLNQANAECTKYMPYIPICTTTLYSAWDSDIEGITVRGDLSSSFMNAYYK